MESRPKGKSSQALSKDSLHDATSSGKPGDEGASDGSQLGSTSEDGASGEGGGQGSSDSADGNIQDNPKSTGRVSSEASSAQAARRKIFTPPKLNLKLKTPKFLVLVMVALAVLTLVLLMRKKTRTPIAETQEFKSRQREQIKRDLARELDQNNTALWAEMNGSGAINSRIVALYNHWINFNATAGLGRAPNMTPEEYYYHYVARLPQRSPAVRTVTDIYCRVYFGNEIPDEESWLKYCQAMRHCL